MTRLCSMLIAVLLCGLYACQTQEDCQEQVSLLPKGVPKALEKEARIFYSCAYQFDGSEVIDTVEMQVEKRGDFFSAKESSSECKAYQELYQVSYKSLNTCHYLNFTLAAANNENVFVSIRYRFLFFSDIEMEKKVMALSDSSKSYIYDLGDGAHLRYHLDSGLVCAHGKTFTLKRIQ